MKSRTLPLLSFLLLILALPALAADKAPTQKNRQALNNQLIKAIEKENFSEVDQLIAQGADVNAEAGAGFKLLKKAVFFHSIRIVELLIANGANTKEQGLVAAAVWGDSLEKAKLLLEHGADPNNEESTSQLTPLYKVKSVAMAELLLSNGANINHHSDTFTPLSYVLGGYNGDISPAVRVQLAKLFIAKGANISGDVANELFFDAAANGDVGLLEYLVAHGADVNARNNREETPLFFAAQAGQLNNVKWLIKKGADVNAINIHKVAPLARTKDVAVAEVLLDNGANPNVTDNGMPYTFSIIFYRGNHDLIKLLVKRGADVNARGPAKQTLLFSAAATSDEDLAKLLVGKGADVNAQDNNGDTPLFWAMDNPNIADILLENGADFNHSNSYNQTPLVRAVKNAKIFKRLINKGADVQQTDAQNSTLMHHAAKEGSPEIVDLLLKAGLDINAKNAQGTSPVKVAFSNQRPDMIQYLLDKGARLNPKEENEYEFTHFACQGTSTENTGKMLAILAARGFNLSAKDDTGNSNLHFAVSIISPDIVKSLLDNGADPNVANANGETPLHMVNPGFNPAMVRPIIQSLLDKGARPNAKNKAGVLAKNKISAYLKKVQDTGR